MHAQDTMKALVKPPRRRPGVRRMASHILIFALLGAALLGLGIFGRAELSRRTLDQQAAARVDALLESSMAEVRTAMVSADTDVSRAVNVGFSSRKRTLKDTITAQVRDGREDLEIALMAIDTLEEGVLSRVQDESLKAELTAKLAPEREKIAGLVAVQALQAVQNMGLSHARVSLPVTEPLYPLMFYHWALIAAGAFFLLFAAALLLVWLRYDERKRARVGELLEPLDYLLPFFAGVVVFTLYPIVRVVLMSLQERYRLEGSFAGWGVGNYKYVLKGIPGTSNYFLQGLGNTFLYVLYTVPISTALAVLIAWLLNQKLRFSALFQTTYFLPMVTSVTAVGLVWRWIFNRDFGVLNAVLALFGGGKVDWLQQSGNSMTVLVIFGIWSALPFTIILLLSGLQNIDDNFYTVAKVDGARQWRIFKRITLPLLAPTIGLVLIINSISAFKVFTEVKVLFNGSPGPVLNLYTVVFYIYDMMYEKRELGRAAAAAIVLFFFILVFTVLQRFIQRKWKYD
jgi:multiple sugar transport system permease protein